MVVPSITSQYVFYVFERGVQNAFLVIGLVILIGYSGMMTLGAAAHLAIGGYAYGIYCLLGLPPVLSAAIAVEITMGNPSAPKPAISSGRPGKNATSSGSR